MVWEEFLIELLFLSFVEESYNVTLAVNDVGGQTLGGAMLDKYIFGADVKKNKKQNRFQKRIFFFHFLFRRSFCSFTTSQTFKVSTISKTGF